MHASPKIGGLTAGLHWRNSDEITVVGALGKIRGFHFRPISVYISETTHGIGTYLPWNNNNVWSIEQRPFRRPCRIFKGHFRVYDHNRGSCWQRQAVRSLLTALHHHYRRVDTAPPTCLLYQTYLAYGKNCQFTTRHNGDRVIARKRRTVIYHAVRTPPRR